MRKVDLHLHLHLGHIMGPAHFSEELHGICSSFTCWGVCVCLPEQTPSQLLHMALWDGCRHDRTPPRSFSGVLESARQGRRIQVEEDRRDLPARCRRFVAPPRRQIDSCFTAWESPFEIPTLLLSVEPWCSDSRAVGDADTLIRRSDKELGSLYWAVWMSALSVNMGFDK